MTRLDAYGLFAVSLMLLCYSLEPRSRVYTGFFAGACVLASSYGFMAGTWPFGMVELVWAAVAFARFCRAA